MLDHHTASAQVSELPWQLGLGLVLVDEKPSLFALYRRGNAGDGGVIAWVVALPDDRAVILPVDATDSRPIMTTLSSVRRRWARVMEAELVQAAGRGALHLAA